MSDEQPGQQIFINARDLWASMGTPYYEPDRVTTAFAGSVVREMLHAAFWRSDGALAASASVVSAE